MGEYYKGFADAIDVPVEEVEEFFENKKDAEPSKLKNRCETLLTDDSDGRKKHKSTLDLISRQGLINNLNRFAPEHYTALVNNIIMKQPSADRPEVDCTDFINWLRDEVLNEEMWELNAIGYGEIIARKLTKLGAMECEDGFYYSADRPKGEWKGYNASDINWLRNDGSPIFLTCDRCNGTVINNGSAHWNYCPNCGADMKGEEGENE